MEQPCTKLVEQIIEKKVEVRSLKNKINELEFDLIKSLIHDGRYDLLQINYSRLCRVTNVTPLRYR